MNSTTLTPLQAALLDAARTGTRRSKPRYVAGRDLHAIADNYLVLRGARGGLTVIVTELQPGAREAAAILLLREQSDGKCIRVLVPEGDDAINYNFAVEAVSDAYRKTLFGYIDTPSRNVGGASFHPLFIDDAFWDLEPTREPDELIPDPTSSEWDEFVTLWSKTMTQETEVYLSSDDGESVFVMFDHAVGDDASALRRRAFENLTHRNEISLREWLGNALEYELHEAALLIHTANEQDSAA